MIDINRLDNQTTEIVYSRFDFGVKYEMANSIVNNDINDSVLSLYREHLYYWNSFKEESPSKNSFDDYLGSFISLVKYVSSYGRKEEIIKLPPLPIANKRLINGMHRLATCCALNTTELLTYENIYSPYKYDQNFFENYTNPHNGKVFPSNLINKIGNSLVRSIPTKFFLIHSNSLQMDNGLYAYKKIEENFNILYSTEFRSSLFSIHYLFSHLYAGQAWTMNSANGLLSFANLSYKISECIDLTKGEYLSRIIFIEPKNIEIIKKIKKDIRKYYGIDNHSIHSSDTIQESLDIALLLSTPKESVSMFNIINAHIPSLILDIVNLRVNNSYGVFKLNFEEITSSFNYIKKLETSSSLAFKKQDNKHIWFLGSLIIW